MFANTRSSRVSSRSRAASAPFAMTLLVVVACGDASGASAHADVTPPPTPVRIASVSAIGAASVTASGTLGAKDEVPLAFKMGGVVSRIAVDAGDRVAAGQVLAELDLREIDAAVAKATAAVEKARRDAARVERLYKDSVATLAQSQFYGKFTRNPIEVAFDETKDGKNATYRARWASQRGEVGPWSVPVTFRIAA